MVKKGENTTSKRRQKKKESFFNFNKLRRTLRKNEKYKIISFFTSFKNIFNEMNQSMNAITQQFDLTEQKVNNFQGSFYKELSEDSDYNNKEREFNLSQKDLEELFGKENISKKVLIKTECSNTAQKNLVKIKSEDNSESLNNKVNNDKPKEFSEKLFDYKNFKQKIKKEEDNNNILTSGTKAIYSSEVGQWINKN